MSRLSCARAAIIRTHVRTCDRDRGLSVRACGRTCGLPRHVRTYRRAAIAKLRAVHDLL
jgi:hypothetical protein